MNPITTARAARSLGVTAQKLRRWIQEGRFENIEGIGWDPGPGFQKQRVYSVEWIEQVAVRIGATPDLSVLEEEPDA